MQGETREKAAGARQHELVWPEGQASIQFRGGVWRLRHPRGYTTGSPEELIMILQGWGTTLPAGLYENLLDGGPGCRYDLNFDAGELAAEFDEAMGLAIGRAAWEACASGELDPERLRLDAAALLAEQPLKQAVSEEARRRILNGREGEATGSRELAGQGKESR